MGTPFTVGIRATLKKRRMRQRLAPKQSGCFAFFECFYTGREEMNLQFGEKKTVMNIMYVCGCEESGAVSFFPDSWNSKT